MTEDADNGDGWFAGVPPGDVDAGADAVVEGSAEAPRDWPTIAVESGFAESPDDYYCRLHETTMAATRREVHAHERADDQQLIHAIRAMDDMTRKLV